VEQEESPGASATVEEAEESAWTEIEERLTHMPPYDFQELVAGLLRGMGYHVAWVAPPGPDRGIDVLAFSDPLGIHGPRIKVQVKRTDRIQVREVRSFMSVLADGDVGIFVSTGGFTKDSEDEARNQERRRIMLLASFEGFVVIQSTLQLDVVSVYTVPGGIDVVPVAERKIFVGQ